MQGQSGSVPTQYSARCTIIGRWFNSGLSKHGRSLLTVVCSIIDERLPVYTITVTHGENKVQEYVDFSEVPPKRKWHVSTKDSSQSTAVRTPLIPDFPTWTQCFTLFITVKTSVQPSLTADLIMMAYMTKMAIC